MKPLPDFDYEKSLWKEDFTVIGIDEVGRGAFAGPVCVGGVIFSSKLSNKDKKYLLSLGIDDSKKLTPAKRKSFAFIIKDYVESFSISFIGVEIINEIGIGKATFLAMQNVAKKLSSKAKNPYLVIDAFKIPGVLIPQSGIIHGDSLSISIACASILAKVERDRLMEEISSEFPQYHWGENKGYGTLKHRKAISEFGLSKHHRVEFCRNVEANLLF